MLLVHGDFGRLKGQGLNEVEIGVSDEGSENPEEWLFILIVRFGRNVEILQVSLSVEGDLSSFYFSVLLINFVSDEDDGNVVTDSSQILIPLGDILVGDSSGDVEHQDRGIGTDVVSFSEATQLFLSGSIPKTKLNGSMISVESD